MYKQRSIIMIGVILVALALVGTALAAASQARQAVSLTDIPITIIDSYQPGSSLPVEKLPQHAAPSDHGADSDPAYTPYLPAHPTVDRQLPDGKRPGSITGTILGDPGDWDSNHVYAPTILYESGTLYMWYSGIAWDGSGAIGLATSSDGITWTKSLSNPFLVGSEGSIIKVDTNDYRMFYSNWDDGNIYVAHSTDGMDWIPQPGAVFTATHQEGDWDMDWVSDPMVYFDGVSTYYMFYEGGTNEPNIAQIGLATSSDGLVWARYQEDPVLAIGDPSSWDEWSVLDPMVVVDGSDWKMWYRGMDYNNNRSIGYATSADGVNWTKYEFNPVFSADPNNWDNGGLGGSWVIYDGSSYEMWYYANRQIGYASSPDGIEWTRLDHSVLQPSPMLYIELNYAHDWAHLYTLPNETVTVTLVNGENVTSTLYGSTNSWGDFWSSDWNWDNGWQDIQPYDSIYFEVAGLSDGVDPIGEIQGVLDVDADTVVGSLNAPWFDEVSMACELWSDPWVTIPITDPVQGNGGTYECNFAAQGVDLQPGMQVAVVYFEPEALEDRVINVIEAPWMRVNYGHDWVGGNYPAGHTFNITLYDSLGEVKATVEIQSESGRGWGGDGFETSWEQWTPQSPDIQPYDKVTFQSDNGFYDEVLVGDIQGSLDINLDLISGPVYTDWYTDDLNIECHPWGAPPGTNPRNSTAGPDGDAPYTCDWSGEWDILPGQDVAVMYVDPYTTDRVINVFRDPAPNMRVSKWTEGNPWVLPGAPAVFTIQYSNDGDGAAEFFTITDTLPASTTYLADSSGVTPTIDNGWVAWELGLIDPGEWGQFQVVLLNNANPGDVLTNEVEIFALYDFDDSNDFASAQAWVGEGNYDLYVNKYPNPGDPLPGDTYVYQIDYGNQDAYASGVVTLTEELPEGTSLVIWESWNNYDLWEQVSYADNVLVLRTPALPGYWGDNIRLTLLVDENVPYGTQLTNTVEITTPGDYDPGNNWQQHTDAWTSPSRLDGRIHKNVPWGSIVPGGELVYPISFYNDGNTTFDALITDTLPEGMSYVASYAWFHGNEFTFDPIYVDDQVVVWEYADLPPGEWIDVDLRLAVDAGFEPGSTATNCIELDSGGSEATPWNNTACVDYMVQDLGPNLRLTKSYQWNWEGQLQYHVEIQNIGSQALDDVWVTDTYPLSTTWNGNWWWWGPEVQIMSNVIDHQLIFWVDYLNPTDSAGVGFQMDLDGGIIGEKGLMFTNLAESPIAGDVNPADNTTEVTAYTGADVYIKKWLNAGVPLPGEILTFTIEFGNLNYWPWESDTSIGSHITDTLPDGMTFITATAPWDVNQFWTPESQDDGVIRWGWGPMWGNSTWRFDLVVQLADDLKDGDVLTNFIEAYGDNPEDYDFDWSNNFSEYDITIDIPTVQFFLPTVYK